MQWLALTLALLSLVSIETKADVDSCDRRPLGSRTAPLRPDNRFAIDIVGVGENYNPDKEYKVKLYAIDGKSTFIAFTIFVVGDTEYNAINPRKPIDLDPGRLGLQKDSDDVTYKPNCNNVLIQTTLTPKTGIEASWTAPKKDQKCVTMFAAVAIKQNVWFKAEGPLSKKVCEDLRKAEDMPPIENENCKECKDARYRLTFEGTWSVNTHRAMFPNNTALARFSDAVGAAHDKFFRVFRSNAEASAGLKMLAEQGNTTSLELEILDKLPKNVRTVIKATGQPRPNMTTTAMFRVTPTHHLVSIVSAVIPSPDWFLGVSNYELCDAITNTWIEHGLLNLYPMDAGTDSGATFEAANEATFPPQSINTAEFIKKVPKETLKPFAKLKFDLIRTYDRRGMCEEQASEDWNESEETTTEPTAEPTEPTSVAPDVNSSEDCPMTPWSDWSVCDGECVDGMIKGIRYRERYHLVNGVPIEKYGVKVEPGARVPDNCKETVKDFEEEPCEIKCESPQIIPGQSFPSK